MKKYVKRCIIISYCSL